MKHHLIFGLQWLAVSLLGFCLSLYWIEVGYKPDITMSQGAIAGSLIGLLQWFVMRRRIPAVSGWIIASAIAWALLAWSHLGAIGWMVPRVSPLWLRGVYGMVNGLQVGGILGIAQWLVLRSVTVRSEYWIIGNVAAWMFAVPTGWMVGGWLHGRTSFFLGEVIGLGVMWLIVSVVTAWLWSQMFQPRLERGMVKLSEY
jgi:hypothetical protein